MRSIAQVVVTRAQRAGWDLLLDKLTALAHCEDTDATVRLVRTCQVIDSLDLKDLVASPTVLLNAAIQDLLDAMKAVPASLASSAFQAFLIEVATRWPQGGFDTLPAAVRAALLDLIEREVKASCAATDSLSVKYAHVVGMCLLQGDLRALSQCDVSGSIAECGPASSEPLQRLWELTAVLFPPNGSAKPIAAVNLAFALFEGEVQALPEGDATKAAKTSYLAAAKDLLVGLTTKDWVSATSGGVRVLELVAKDDHARVLGLLAAVGNYALTFDTANNPDPAEAAEAREEIITELVDRMVNRTDRDGGAVLSLGGALSALGGVRLGKVGDEIDHELSFPLQLALGVGLQTYGTHDCGFHMMVSVLDLGQYVTFQDNLEVGTPDIETSIEAGLSLGYWFTLRETPLFIAAHGSVTPFNRADGRPTFQLGGLFGIYVPLLDFN